MEVREQKKACEQLNKHQHWKHSPRGPTYTLVLDCAGLRPYHFGRAMRKSVSALTHDFIHYYPDFVGARISSLTASTATQLSPHSHPLPLDRYDLSRQRSVVYSGDLVGHTAVNADVVGDPD